VSGIARVVLTDKEINLLLGWYAAADEYNGAADHALAERLHSYRDETACAGDNCPVPE
jgi:hypothetical protein